MKKALPTISPADVAQVPRPRRLWQWAVWVDHRLAGWARPEVAFWRLGLSFGLLFLLLTPPFQVPDEQAHFFRSYQISEGDLVAERADSDQVGDDLPKNIFVMTNEVKGDVSGQPHKRVALDKLLTWLNAPLNEEDRVFVDFRGSAGYAPLVYLPQILGIMLGRLMGLPPPGLVYCGRLGNLLVGLLLTCLAIHWMPVMKWWLMLLALMPMTVFQRSSLSADGLTIALAFVFIAAVLRLALRAEAVTRREVILLCALAAIFCLCKQGYYPLILSCLIIPRRKFSGTKQYLTALLSILVAGGLATFLWMSAVKGLQSPFPGKPDAAMMAGQRNYLLQNPLQLAAIFYNSYELNYYFYLSSFIGLLGWLDTPLPYPVIAAYACLLLLLAFIDGGQAPDWLGKLWLLALFIGNTFILALFFYISYTELRSPTIEGIQGRYLIPLAPLLFLVLCPRRWRIDLSAKRLHWLLIAFLVLTLTITLRVIIRRYYLPVTL